MVFFRTFIAGFSASMAAAALGLTLAWIRAGSWFEIPVWFPFLLLLASPAAVLFGLGMRSRVPLHSRRLLAAAQATMGSLQLILLGLVFEHPILLLIGAVAGVGLAWAGWKLDQRAGVQVLGHMMLGFGFGFAALTALLAFLEGVGR